MKRSFILSIFMVFVFTTWVSAFSQTPYGGEFFHYGKRLELTGDFTPSGVPQNFDGSYPTRFAYLVKSDMHIANVNSGQTNYVPEVMSYNIHEKDSTEDFKDKRGYLLIPMEEQVIRDWATKFNGNPEYIVQNIMTSVSPDFENARYVVDHDKKWVNLATILLYSGGGGDNPTVPSRNPDDWQKYPTSEFDFDKKVLTNHVKLTSFPAIRDFSLNTGANLTDGSIFRFDFSTYSVYNKKAIAYLYVNDGASGWEISNLATFDSGTEIKVQKQMTLVDFPNIKTVLREGENTLKLVVRDGYYRMSEKEITVNYNPQSNLKASEIWYAPDPVNPNDQVTISALITNESSESIETEVVARKDGVEIGRQPMTLAGGQAVRTTGFSFTAPNVASVNVEFEVNPDKTKPTDESDWKDNQINRPIPIVKPNLKLEQKDIWYTPDPVEPNDAARVSILVQNQYNQAVTTDVRAKKDGQVIATKTVKVPANGSVRTPAFTFTAPNKSEVNVEFEVNPGKNKPANETIWADNKANKDLPIAQAKNIAVTITKTPEVSDSLKRFTYKANVTNTGNTTETFTLSIHQPYKDSFEECDNEGCWWEVYDYPNEMDRSFSVTLKPKETKSFDVQGFSGWDYFDFDYSEYSITITASVTRLPGEERYNDNTATKTIPVKPMRLTRTLHLEK